MSLNPDISRSTCFTEEQVAGFVIVATKDVFSTMVMMDVIDDFPLKEPVSRFKCSITGMVGFAGTYSGVISIHCPVPLALKITSNMLIDEDRVAIGVSARGTVAPHRWRWFVRRRRPCASAR